MGINIITPENAKIISDNTANCIIDIRDPQAYEAGHIRNAKLINNSNIADYVQSADKNTPLIIYCYSGNSSQNAAHYFSEQGFTEVYSLQGGFNAWKNLYPDLCSTEE